MLATTIHKSNTTPHHQRRGDNTPPGHPGPTGLLPQSPIVCLAIHQPDVRSLEPRTGINVCCCTRTAPTTGTAHLTNRPGHRTPTRCGRAMGLVVLLRKEVIQPHLPVRLPCYDFVPIADPTFDGSLPRGVRPPASGVTDFHDVTGGVYKARERIHRSVADLRLLATPTSRGRVADPDPN
jgi:hypothetical protein